MSILKRFQPSTKKAIKIKGLVSLVLVVIALICATIVINNVRNLGNPTIFSIAAVLGFPCALFGIMMTLSFIYYDYPNSRAFWTSNSMTQAEVQRVWAEEKKHRGVGGTAGAGDGMIGCLGVILELVSFSIPRTTTGYWVEIRFDTIETIVKSPPTLLQVDVSNDLYARVRQGSKIMVQYATADPHVALLGSEIGDDYLPRLE